MFTLVEVVGVRIEMPSNQPIVLLREMEGRTFLPIWVGSVEATAIAFAQQELRPQRPLTHDLIVDLLGNNRCNALTAVRITDMVDGIFYAETRASKCRMGSSASSLGASIGCHRHRPSHQEQYLRQPRAP